MDESFDFVYSIRTLNQVGSRTYALDVIREIMRVCRKQGFILLEFVNRFSLALGRKPSTRLSVRDIKRILKEHNRSFEIVHVSGVLFFTQTLMNFVPPRFLNAFEKIDTFFADLLPSFSTRCYVILRKNG
jgi:ubiquinone/menaquinone biosynthesis C-methylase UbiE